MGHYFLDIQYHAYLDIGKIVCMSGPEEEVQLYGYVDVWCQLGMAHGLNCEKCQKIFMLFFRLMIQNMKLF